MWICINCGTENENNFKFCWSCGRTREQSNPVEVRQVTKEIPTKTEPKKAPIREIRSFEEIKPVEETKPVKEIETVETTKAEKRNSARSETEIFSSVLPYAAKSFSDANESDWEIKVFRTAVRLVGLFLLYQVFASVPDFIILLYTSVKSSTEFSGALTNVLIIPLAKILLYLIVGIYLIASGRILLWLLPRN